MALQGSRRLCESLFVFKPGSSPMWFIHWALGLAYYITISLAVWVEGSSTFLTISHLAAAETDKLQVQS
jgi:3-oxo-5-alpha-steroid 4-dehydrogenase 3